MTGRKRTGWTGSYKRLEEQRCRVCKQKRTKEGHDPCLGTLPGVIAACCGHGDPNMAYVYFENGVLGYQVRFQHADDPGIMRSIRNSLLVTYYAARR